MEKALNTLPVQTYVRSRVSTIVTDVGNDSAGTVALNLAKPSDVTVIVASEAFAGQPSLFVAAIDRTPTLSDFDLIVSPTDDQFVKAQDRVTLCLPAGQHEFRWKGLSTAGAAQTFPGDCSLLVLAIDQ